MELAGGWQEAADPIRSVALAGGRPGAEVTRSVDVAGDYSGVGGIQTEIKQLYFHYKSLWYKQDIQTCDFVPF